MKNLDNPIDFARHRRQAATSGEFLMWQIVRDRQRCKKKFRREHPIGPYTCDFYCVEAKLDIECDGKDHFTEEGRARDAIRDAWMKRHGITTLRFTNQQIENDTQTVINIIDGKLLELASPSPPTPLPEDGERGARVLEGPVREKQPTTMDEACPSNAQFLSGPVFVSESLGDGSRPPTSNAQSPPRPVFGERGQGGEGEHARTIRTTHDQESEFGMVCKAIHEGPQAKPSGFTLIELLVTLVIVSVLAAATLPAFKNVIVERKTSVAALEVKAFLDAARARAVSRGRPVSVILERLSSRWNGTYNSTAPFVAQSSTANNTPSGVQDNFDVYNTCIRMVMAESLRSIEYDISVTITAEDLPTGSSQLGNDNDGVLEPCRILTISNSDARLARDISIGNEIELVDQNEHSHFFRIKNFTTSGTNYIVVIDNEGNATSPFGSISEINTSASNQSLIPLFTNLVSPMSKLRIRSVPRPIASMVTELPRGSCIDLSLSGLANDDPNVNPSSNVYRDCRREFASDWVLPPVPANLPPIPSQLRPVYLTFGPTGKLASVLCNAPQVGTPNPANPLTYTSNLRRIEPQSDVCLFVGRNDQVIAASNTADLAAAEDASLKPNLMDASGYWVRVSPSSGIISAAPAQASHIIEDVADFRGGNPAEPIGHLLEDSRSLIFGAELTSQ